jgi:SAM-dependent methyltransferase
MPETKVKTPITLNGVKASMTAGVPPSDLEFDEIYDERIQWLSLQHWTPVRVAARAATLLTQAGATRILDVGSGVGKFCIVGALTTDAEFVGVEQRGDLVEIARRSATRLGAARASFVHANVDAFPFDGFSAVYMYNPFYEQISRLVIEIDHEIERSQLLYRRFVQTTIDKLAALPPPVSVVTFHGFGGSLAPHYEFRGDEPAGNDLLELWIKR